MGETEQEKTAGRKRPEFVKAFTTKLRWPGARGNMAGRVLTGGLVVVLAGAVAVGVGAFIKHKNDSVDTTTNSAGRRPVQTSPAPGGSPTVKGATPGAPGAPLPGVPLPGRPLQSSPGGGVGSIGEGSGTSSAPGSTRAPGSTSSPVSPQSGARGHGGASVRRQTVSVPVRRIQGFASNRCVDVTDGRSAAGTPVQIWDCNTFAQQRWEFHPDGTLRSLGKCLAVAGSSRANGAVIRIESCNAGPGQRFTLNGAHDLVNIAADKCVDVKDQSTGNGARLQLWQCGGSANQKWRTV